MATFYFLFLFVLYAIFKDNARPPKSTIPAASIKIIAGNVIKSPPNLLLK